MAKLHDGAVVESLINVLVTLDESIWDATVEMSPIVLLLVFGAIDSICAFDASRLARFWPTVAAMSDDDVLVVSIFSASSIDLITSFSDAKRLYASCKSTLFHYLESHQLLFVIMAELTSMSSKFSYLSA